MNIELGVAQLAVVCPHYHDKLIAVKPPYPNDAVCDAQRPGVILAPNWVGVKDMPVSHYRRLEERGGIMLVSKRLPSEGWSSWWGLYAIPVRLPCQKP